MSRDRNWISREWACADHGQPDTPDPFSRVPDTDAPYAGTILETRTEREQRGEQERRDDD